MQRLPGQRNKSITNYIEDFYLNYPKADMLPLTVHKDYLIEFFANLGKLLLVVKKIAKKVMLPAIFTENPANPEDEFMIVLRSVKSMQKFTLDKHYVNAVFNDYE